MPRALNKKHDFQGLIPRDWNPETRGDVRRWRTRAGVIVYCDFIAETPAPVSELSEDYRGDAHLSALSNGGGLVECEMIPGRGVFAITRLPDHGRESGLIYTGMALTPFADGHLAWTAMARETSNVGARENQVYRELHGD